MGSEFRIDIGGLRAPERLADGRLKVEGHLTRAGVFEYLNPDGSIRREYRPPEEVFSPASLRSFQLVPVTNLHPPDGQLITARTAREHMVGTTGESVRRDGDHVAGPMVINDENTIAALEAGRVYLSCGYTVDYDPTPGVTPDGQRYDGVQRSISGNHVALVDHARAGDSARVRMDAGVMREDKTLDAEARDKLRESSFAVPDRDGLPIEDEAHLRAAMARFGQYEFKDDAERRAAVGRILKKAKALGVDASGFEKAHRSDDGHDTCMPAATGYNRSRGHEMADENLQTALAQLAAATARADAADAKLKEASDRADAAEGTAESLRQELTAIKTARTDEAGKVTALTSDVERLQGEVASLKARCDAAESPERFRAAVKDRVRDEVAAAAVLGEDTRLDEMTDRQLMEAVIKHLQGAEIPADKPDAYVRGRFDTAIEGYKSCGAQLARLRDAGSVQASEPRADASTAREGMIQRNRNAWKPQAPKEN